MQPAWTTLVILLQMVLMHGNDTTGEEHHSLVSKGQANETLIPQNGSITNGSIPTPTVADETLVLAVADIAQLRNVTNETRLETALGCQNAISPSGSCSFHGNVNITINASYPCIFSCSYNPNVAGVRLEVHLQYENPTKNPTFVSVEQKSFLNSWTLPIMFPVHGENQKYTSIQEILCPPFQSYNETLKFRITTRYNQNISMLFSLKDEIHVLMKGDNVSLTSTPVSPWYKLYKWSEKENSVLVTADSKNNSASVCAILALQNAKCPVKTDEFGLQGGVGHYQTFTAQAGMVAWKSDYPDGVHIIFFSLPDDEPCTLNIPNTPEHTKRHKTIVLTVYDHATIWTTWYIYFISAAVLGLFTTGLTCIVFVLISRNLNFDITDDERQLLEESMESFGREYRVEMSTGAIFSGPNNFDISCRRPVDTRENILNIVESTEGNGNEGNQDGTEGSERDSYDQQITALQLPLTERPAIAPSTTYAPNSSLMNFTATFNPYFVGWWKQIAVFEAETAEAQVGEVGFIHNLLIMSVFAALPTAELVRSYLGMLRQHGVEDRCFFNSRCLTAFGYLPDFTRVFTNISYILGGIAFSVVVKKHRQLTHSISKNFNAFDNVGVSRHYGLFLSLGYSLIIQGLMSSLYHTCPNSVTIRFDMLFMYVILVVAVVTIWGLRHGDVTHHVYPTLAFISLALIMAEVHEWINKSLFWTVFSVSYFFILSANTILLTKYGIWSFSPYKMWCVWKGWKPVVTKLEEVIRDQDRTSGPCKVLRIVIGLATNVGLITYGCIVDPNIYSYLLVIFLSNTGMYFGNYMITKKLCYQEKGTWLGWFSLFISSLLWILALIAFCSRITDSEASPAHSRALNSPCDFLTIYDKHDIWHTLSAFALYFFFLGVLTIDDDLYLTPSKLIHVF